MTVSPALLTAQVGTKQSQTTIAVSVRNGYDTPITVKANLNGFDIRNNALVPAKTAEAALTKVVTINPSEITIPAHSSKNITVQINDDASLSPGGHYLSLLISQLTATSDTSTPQLSLKTAVSATIYVIKEDGAIRSLQVTNLHAKHSIFSLPTTADITFFNNGNVVVVPRSVVQIGTAATGSIAAQAVLNQDSVPLYPGSRVTLQAPLQRIDKISGIGRVSLVAHYRADGQELTKSAQISFWYIPKKIVVAGIFLLAIVAVLGAPTSRQWILTWHRQRHRRRPSAFVAPTADDIAKSKLAATSVRKKSSRRISL